MPKQVVASLRYLRIAPRKVRFVADSLRGLPAIEAQEQLAFLNKKAARPLAKLLRSAIANAEHNFQLEPELLRIARLEVNEGRAFRRLYPRARGRADIIRKKTSHVTMVLEAEVPEKKRRRPLRKTIPKKEVGLSLKEEDMHARLQEEERERSAKHPDEKRVEQRPLRRLKDFRPRIFRRKSI